MPAVGDKVKFHYEKSHLFRIVHVDGAIGGSSQPYMRQLQFGAKVTF